MWVFLVLLPPESFQWDIAQVVQSPWSGPECRTPGEVWPAWSRRRPPSSAHILPPFSVGEQRGLIYTALVLRCVSSGAAVEGKRAPPLLQQLSVGHSCVAGWIFMGLCEDWKCLKSSTKTGCTILRQQPLSLPVNFNTRTHLERAVRMSCYSV